MEPLTKKGSLWLRAGVATGELLGVGGGVPEAALRASNFRLAASESVAGYGLRLALLVDALSGLPPSHVSHG